MRKTIDIQYKTLNELETEILIGKEKAYSQYIKVIMPTAIIFIITCIIFFHFLSIEILQKILIFIIIFCIILALFYICFKGKNKISRTCIQFSISNNVSKEEIIKNIEDMLKKLLYKEKKYKNEMVFYAYKTIYYVDITSNPRYLKYEITDSTINFYVWPITESTYELNGVILEDLKHLNECINKLGEKKLNYNYLDFLETNKIILDKIINNCKYKKEKI